MSDPADTLAARVSRGTATEEELAALIAVVTESYAREVESAVVDSAPGSTPWARMQRPLRAPLRRDIPWGRWAG